MGMAMRSRAVKVFNVQHFSHQCLSTAIHVNLWLKFGVVKSTYQWEFNVSKPNCLETCKTDIALFVCSVVALDQWLLSRLVSLPGLDAVRPQPSLWYSTICNTTRVTCQVYMLASRLFMAV